MADWILRASGLRKLYGPVGIVDANVGICPGECVAVLGRSGSGKSTLMAMIAGLCRPERGTVELRGDQFRAPFPHRPAHPYADPCLDLWGLSTADRCRLRRGSMGFISQFTSLLPALTTLENVLLPTQLAGQPSDPHLALRRRALVGCRAPRPSPTSAGRPTFRR